jgi:hypothetical protein
MGCRNAASARALSLPRIAFTVIMFFLVQPSSAVPAPTSATKSTPGITSLSTKSAPWSLSTPLTSESRPHHRSVVGDRNRLRSGRIAVLDDVLTALLELLHRVSRHRCSKGQRERANQRIREITSAEVSRVIAREVRRDNEEISRNIVRTLTSDSGGNLWHKHPNTSIAPVEKAEKEA